MKSSLAPYVQICLVIWRSLLARQSRWLYFLSTAAWAAFMVIGGGVVLGGTISDLLKAGAAVLAIALQIGWLHVVTSLLTLNHPNAARAVPRFTSLMRCTALGIWLAICALTGLLGEGALGQGPSAAYGAGLSMLVLSTPFRWPVRWCFFIAALVVLGRYAGDLGRSILTQLMVPFMSSHWIIPTAAFLGMGWLVTRLVATSGSGYSAVFPRYQSTQDAWTDLASGRNSSSKPWGATGVYLMKAGQWLTLPLQQYSRRLQSAPQATAVHVLARAELAFGATVHWVTQVSLMVAVMAAGMVIFVFGSWGSASTVAQVMPVGAMLVSMALLLIAVLPLLGWKETLLATQVEQKLMLLLPGMPHGTVLNRMLAARHVRQCAVAWLTAAAISVALLRTHSDAGFASGFYLAVLLVMPLAIGDLARIEVPNAWNGIKWLILATSGPAACMVVSRWLHVSVMWVWAVAFVWVFASVASRWKQLANFEQALPAGRLAVQDHQQA